VSVKPFKRAVVKSFLEILTFGRLKMLFLKPLPVYGRFPNGKKPFRNRKNKTAFQYLVFFFTDVLLTDRDRLKLKNKTTARDSRRRFS
jgi:hypothetical protein